jgi:hypothetical protein
MARSLALALAFALVLVVGCSGKKDSNAKDAAADGKQQADGVTETSGKQDHGPPCDGYCGFVDVGVPEVTDGGNPPPDVALDSKPALDVPPDGPAPDLPPGKDEVSPPDEKAEDLPPDDLPIPKEIVKGDIPSVAGACTNPEDEGIITSGKEKAAMPKCAPGCIGKDAACVADCLVKETGLSPECAACYGEWIYCTFQNCKDKCQNGPESPACFACQGQFCNDDFKNCTGFVL